MIPNADQLARYHQLRKVGQRVSQDLVKRLSKDRLHAGARQLDMLRGDTLVFSSEAATVCLMDHCVYDIRRKGRNVVDEWLADAPYAPGSDEMLVLKAMKDAFYSMFLIESVERGVGVHLLDALRMKSFFLVDVNLSQTAPPGALFSGRVYCVEGLWQTTGAILPMAEVPASRRDEFLRSARSTVVSTSFEQMTPEDASKMATTLIQANLATGADEHVRLHEPQTGGIPRAPLVSRQQSQRVGRNDPCPCGSGKKFKHCCMRR